MVSTGFEHMEIQEFKNYKKVPPEGRWGLLVLLGVSLCMTFTLGTFPSLALVFGEFFKELGEETSALTMLMSWYFGSFSCVGLVTNYFFKTFSVRGVALTGAFIFVLGSLLAVFARTLGQLIFSFGVLEGAGFGLMISSSYTTFNGYFVRKRTMMMSVAQSIYGVGTMIYPIFVQYVMEEYGYRGFMAIRAGIHLHVIFCMLVMHPVEWHMKKIMVEDVLLERDRTDVGACNPNEVLHNQQMEVDDKNSVKFSLELLWKKIVDFLDLTLLKDPIYANICLGMAFALYSDMAFFAIQPLYLLELNFSKSNITQIVAIGAIADLVSRIFLAISTSCIRVRARDIYLIGAILTIVARFALFYVTDYLGMAILTATMGFLRTWIHVPISLVVAEYLSLQRFPSGYGLFMFIQGMIMFLFGPIVGWIRDVTQDFIITFHCLTFAMGICAVPWLGEMIWMRIRKH